MAEEVAVASLQLEDDNVLSFSTGMKPKKLLDFHGVVSNSQIGELKQQFIDENQTGQDELECSDSNSDDDNDNGKSVAEVANVDKVFEVQDTFSSVSDSEKTDS